MTTTHVHAEEFPVDAARLFDLLLTPSAVRAWWRASRVIVLAEEGGTWAATWGEDEDAPDYVTVARIRALDPPRRLVLDDYRYASKDGPLPFDFAFTTSFVVESFAGGARLRVEQEGFPETPEGEAFRQACETGWQETFAGIRRFLEAGGGAAGESGGESARDPGAGKEA